MERNDGGTGSKTSNIIFCEFLCLLRGNYLMTYLSREFSRLRGRIIDEMRSNLNAHPYSMFSFPGSILGPLEWACPEYLGLSSIVCGLALGVFTLPCTNGVSLGLPYLEKQKSGQWMATLHQAKFMGFSIIFITKSGRPNSFVDIQGGATEN